MSTQPQPREANGRYSFKAAGAPATTLAPVCTTQAEVDAALSRGDRLVRAHLGAGESLYVVDAALTVSGSGTVRAEGRSRLDVDGDLTVIACGWTDVNGTAREVVAFEDATGELGGSTRVTARDRCQVSVIESATCRAFEDAQVTAVDDATVLACERAAVTVPFGSPQVWARDRASVVVEPEARPQVVVLGRGVGVEQVKPYCPDPDVVPRARPLDVTRYSEAGEQAWSRDLEVAGLG